MTTTDTLSQSKLNFARSIRIAIALAALRFKPAKQSYEAYVLDLRSKFSPDETQRNEDWRERALTLEQSLKALETKYEKEHAELQCMREAQSGAKTSAESAAAGQSKSKKKKAKGQVDAPVLHPKPELKTLLGGMNAKINLAKLSSTPDLLSTFETLDMLVSSRSGESSASAIMDESLATSLRHAVDSLGSLLTSLLPPNPVTAGAVDALDAAATLIHRLLIVALSLLVGTPQKQKIKATSRFSIVEDTLRVLTETILVPAIRAFRPLSSAHLSVLLAPRAKKKVATKLPSDIRPDLFSLLDRTISALEEFSSLVTRRAAVIFTIRTVKQVVALETVRELQRLYAGDHASGSDANSKSKSTLHDARVSQTSERMESLIRKDTLWYLCNVLHLVLPLGAGASVPTPQRDQDELLDDAIFGALSSVLRRTRTTAHFEGGTAPPGNIIDEGSRRGTIERPTPDMGDVERGVVLALAERVWLGR
ncbi:uncharacterized protein LAESUDRAFT_566792 [Laetiporus sulphureus 93-53]|uniref:Uncharacterized protein n=1 Tax=Laetiporus sulphureus 93-53 TaxID=1314785 RepID=A0A165FGG9_9APHY|nr:uncharacterized protein LAESUDRAFT_566792 [Laetiporus sulphureus 93-53]KZT08934.1 hypothetical protein LAESUDRAFT_566792 [Laetiporus sulphureus 93-53]